MFVIFFFLNSLYSFYYFFLLHRTAHTIRCLSHSTHLHHSLQLRKHEQEKNQTSLICSRTGSCRLLAILKYLIKNTPSSHSAHQNHSYHPNLNGLYHITSTQWDRDLNTTNWEICYERVGFNLTILVQQWQIYNL